LFSVSVLPEVLLVDTEADNGVGVGGTEVLDDMVITLIGH
jgi:hypothetical protein